MHVFSVETHNLSCDLSQLPIFEKDNGKDGHLDDDDDDDEGQADHSDSEESVFSGLEESGSDSDDEEEEDEEEDDDDDVSGLKSCDVKEDKRTGEDVQLSTKDITEPQVLIVLFKIGVCDMTIFAHE